MNCMILDSVAQNKGSTRKETLAEITIHERESGNMLATLLKEQYSGLILVSMKEHRLFEDKFLQFLFRQIIQFHVKLERFFSDRLSKKIKNVIENANRDYI